MVLPVINNEEIFSLFHALLALDTGNLKINASLCDFSEKPEQYKEKKGKYLTVCINENKRDYFGEYASSQECMVVADEERFCINKLKNKKQEEWGELDYKIAKQILECYAEFILSDKKSYYDQHKISKAEVLEKKCLSEAGKSKKKGKKSMKKHIELIRMLVKANWTKDEIKLLFKKHFELKNKTSYVAEDIQKSDGQPFKWSEKIDKPIDNFLKAIEPKKEISWSDCGIKEYKIENTVEEDSEMYKAMEANLGLNKPAVK